MAHAVVQQVTSQTPAPKQKKPKRVAAGKAIAQKTKRAREAQKKAFIELQSTIANNQTKVDPPPDTPSAVEPTKNALTTTQWLSVFSIIVSLVGLYYKREELKTVFTKKLLLKCSDFNRHHLFCHEPRHHRLLMLNEKWES